MVDQEKRGIRVQKINPILMIVYSENENAYFSIEVKSIKFHLFEIFVTERNFIWETKIDLIKDLNISKYKVDLNKYMLYYNNKK